MPAFFPVSDVDVGDFDKALSAKPAPEALAARFVRPRHAVLAAQPGPDVALAAEGSFEYPENLEHGLLCALHVAFARHLPVAIAPDDVCRAA